MSGSSEDIESGEGKLSLDFIIEKLYENLFNYENLDIPSDIELFIIRRSKTEYDIYTTAQMNKICGFGNARDQSSRHNLSLCEQGNWKKRYFCRYFRSKNLFIVDDTNLFLSDLIKRML